MAQRRVAVAAWRDNQQAGRHEVVTLAQRVGLGLSGVCPGHSRRKQQEQLNVSRDGSTRDTFHFLHRRKKKPRFVKKRGAQKARVEQQRKFNAKISG